MAFSLDRSNTIGFIGLGAMGHHMLNNLVARHKRPGSGEVGYALCDVDQAAVDKIVKHHASEHPNTPLVSCSSPYDVAQKASVIISMVPTGRHVEDVYVGGSKSVLSALESMSQEERAATLCVDQSTIEQKVSKTVAWRLREAGADLVDAPVSGGVIGAEKGTLAIMVGGSKSSFDRAVPVLESMSRKINHPVSDVKVSGSSPPAHRNYEGGFVTKLAHKDLALAVSAADEADVPLAVGRCVEETYRPLANSGKFGNRDFSVIYEALDAMGSSAGNPKL
ncbi:unnamed protein product [Alternaria sp. RS040]